jgi:class 3 adenylate cyclase
MGKVEMQYPEFHYRWEWRLQSPPEELWPLVADTNRFNRDAGLPAVQTSDNTPHPNARRRLRFSMLGINIAWEEEPFEWVRPHRFGVVRRYWSGPTATMRVVAELTPHEDGGTLLAYEVWVRARTPLGLVAIPLTMAQSRRRFGSVFHRYDAEVKKTSYPSLRPSGIGLVSGGQQRLELIKEKLAEQAGDSGVAAWLCDTVERADALLLARLRPYVLADAWGAPRQQVLDVCLHATRSGLLDLQWNVLCPLCRGAKASTPTLRGLQDQVHCDTCNINFTANFDRSVELTFRPNSSIRQTKAQDFCVAGPEVTPHVAAQQLLAPGERRNLALPLEPGRYRLRTLGIPGGRFLVAYANGPSEASLNASLSGWPSDELAISLKPTLYLVNETPDEQLFILERMAWTDQAVTAAEVICRQVFRDLFSSEILRPGQKVSVGALTIVFTDLRDSTRLYRDIGDAPAFGRVLDHFAVLRKAVKAEDGVVVKTIGDAIMAAFPRPVSALRAILTAQNELAAPETGQIPLFLKAGLHHGPCIAVTLNDRLDYFGSTVNIAARLARLSSGMHIVISEAIRNDPEVVELLADITSGLVTEQFEAQLKGLGDKEFALWRVERRQHV